MRFDGTLLCVFPTRFWRRYGSLSRHLMAVKLQQYTKFLFVRDPFVRLISAFRNKFGRCVFISQSARECVCSMHWFVNSCNICICVNEGPMRTSTGSLVRKYCASTVTCLVGCQRRRQRRLQLELNPLFSSSSPTSWIQEPRAKESSMNTGGRYGVLFYYF